MAGPWASFPRESQEGLAQRFAVREVELLVSMIEAASSLSELNEIRDLHGGRGGWRSALAAARHPLLESFIKQ